NAFALNNYAYFLTLRREHLDKALRMAKKANSLAPDNSTFQDTYAWTLFQNEQYNDALLWIEKAVANKTTASATMLDHYGDILLKVNRPHDAVKKWSLALKLLAKNDNERRE